MLIVEKFLKQKMMVYEFRSEIILNYKYIWNIFSEFWKQI